jgi:hypothetical protein
MNNIEHLKENTIWTSQGTARFVVERLVTNEQGLWVFYRNSADPEKTYNCLSGAFLQRFNPYIN